MFAYYRTSSHSTHIQRIIRGSVSHAEALDLVLVKGNCLEWLSVKPITEQNNTLLHSELEQYSFGNILDAQILPCQFLKDERTNIPNSDLNNSEYEELPYSKYIRNHSKIEGQDIIVAISEYGKLVFMTIIHDELLKIKRFETLTEILLDSPGLEFTKAGRKFAIDHYGRAIAISSYQDNFDIFILRKEMSRIHFDPIIGRGSEYEQGIIWDMQFLYTENTSMDRILLVVIVYNDVEKLCRLVLYAINVSNENDIIIEKISRLPLEKNTPLPLLFIPLRFELESFLLVTEQKVSLLTADDLACGNVMYPSSIIPRQFGSIECPLFTAYTTHLDLKKRLIYIGSDEGLLYKLEIKNTMEIKWSIAQNTNPISESMCMLGSMDLGDYGEHDIIMYSGESSNSQLIAIPCSQQTVWSSPTMKNVVLQEIINRAPLGDCQIIEGYTPYQDALVTCSGQNENGSLSTITHGIKAEILYSSKAEWIGISKLWSLPISTLTSDRGSYLLASSILDTKIMYAKDGHISDVTSSSNIDFETETVHANIFSDEKANLLIQVCPQKINAIDLKHPGNKYTLLETNSRIEIATSFQSENKIYIASCNTHQTDFSFVVYKIVNKNKTNIESFSLKKTKIFSTPISACPSCIEYLNLGLKSFIFLGTFDSSLLIFSVNNNSIELVQTVNLNSFSTDLHSVPNSISAVGSSSKKHMHLIIGFRHGPFFSYKLDISSEKRYLIKENETPCQFDVGRFSIRLYGSIKISNSIYVLAEDLWRVTCTDSGAIVIDYVLLPKFSNPVDAFIPFDCGLDSALNELSESVVIVADNKLHVCRLDLKSQKNTQQFSLDETPRRILFDKALNCLIVITSRLEHGEFKNSIHLIDLLSGLPITNSVPLSSETDLNKNEVVLSAAEWSVNNGKKPYKYLCIGIGYSKESFQSFKSGVSNGSSRSIIDKGALLLYRLKASRDPQKKNISLKCIWVQDKLPGGVYALCPYPAGLLFSAGKNLYLYRLDPIKGKLMQVAHKSLPFAITSIRGDENRICVTSNTNSLSIYQFNSESKSIEFLKSDVKLRHMHQSLILNGRIAIGVSQTGGFVCLYDNQNPEAYKHRLDNLCCFHYADIMIKPSLALLRSQNDLIHNTSPSDKHVLSWDSEIDSLVPEGFAKPITTCTISGGVVHIYRISQPLYHLFYTLQETLIEFEPTKPLLGSPENFKSWFCQLSGEEKSSIHGDLVESFLRLSFDEQSKIVKDNDGNVQYDLKAALQNCFPEIDFGNSFEKVIEILVCILTNFEKYR